jgi:hypothetical protein
MTSMGRSRGLNPDILLDNFIMFPPDTHTSMCKKPNPDIACEPTEWSFAVENGKYNVKITVGDA